MNRADYRKIAKQRLKESEILLKNRKYSGSYHLSGYVIECALKACIAKRTKKGEFADLDAVKASYTHNLENLVKSAGLEPELSKRLKASKSFARNWAVVKDWTEVSRYEFHSKIEAQDLLHSISDPKEGVLIWVYRFW